MEGEWFPNTPESSQPQQITSAMMSTAHDLSYSPCDGQKTRDAAQVAATGRYSWKMLKGKPDAVWPPALEAALIDALEEYRKTETHPTSQFGVWYPMRDQFISNYILETTGETRTAKQVSSRLQQLRDTCEDSRLASGIECSNRRALRPAETVSICVQLELVPLGEHQGAPNSPSQVDLNSDDRATPQHLYLMPLSGHPAPPSAFSPLSSSFASFSSLVGLVSPFPLSAETTWTVYQDNAPIHQERAVIRMASPLPITAGRHLYVCDLVPLLWPMLCETQGLSSITIVQTVYSAHEANLSMKEVSIIYRFNIPDYTKPRLQQGPSPHTLSTGLPCSSAPSSSALSQAHHPSHSAVLGHGSRSQGQGHWPSSSHHPYSYWDAGYYPTQASQSRRYPVDRPQWGQHGGLGHQGVSNPFFDRPGGVQWHANGNAPFSPSNLQAVQNAAHPNYHNQDSSLFQEGPSVFGRSANIAVNNYGHITSQVNIHAPAGDNGPQFPSLPNARLGLPRPPAVYRGTSTAIQEWPRPRPGPSPPAPPHPSTPPADSPPPTPPPTNPPTTRGRRTTVMAAILVMVACLVLW